MRVYLAGGVTTGNIHVDKIEGVLQEIKSSGLKLNVLETFFDINRGRFAKLRGYVDNFILDIGAFSFIQSGKHVDWDDYVERYIDFIKKFEVELYFELDIDKLIGYERVKEIRRRIERETNKPVIPVWHISLGKEEFWRMCDAMNYQNLKILREEDVLKFVVGDENDLTLAEKICKEFQPRAQIYISPVFGKIEPSVIADFMKSRHLENWKLQLQLHKTIWNPNERGV